MNPPQRFFSYAEGGKRGDGRELDIQGHLRLMSCDNEELPSLLVRIVPGQVDDLLIAAPDLDKLGFDMRTDSENFILHLAGVSVPRETPCINIRQSVISSCINVHLRNSIVFKPHEMKLVPVSVSGTL